MSKRANDESPKAEYDAALQRKKHQRKLLEYDLSRQAFTNNVVLTASSFASSPTVELLIGTDEKPFHIHKDLLTCHSSYFEARFADRWKSDETMQFRLPDHASDLFKYILTWLYTGEIRIDTSLLDNDENLNWDIWIKLYHQADMLLLTDFQNQMVDMDLSQANRST